MFLLTWWPALIAVVPIFLLLLYSFHRKPGLSVFGNDWTNQLTTSSDELCGRLYQDQSYDETRDIQDSEDHVKGLNARKIHSFYTAISALELRAGAQSLMQEWMPWRKRWGLPNPEQG
ncbi:solute carrier family 12 member 3-like [Vombatus ursinus]|uniref:solute carrier family 12 member 3-like n=1 Tax=Vombatus ursinus TaxID=29139 RepID=UPI000FFD0CDD|nr:solute carrier family 12 member 3-like [Vombatus ursinus]